MWQRRKWHFICPDIVLKKTYLWSTYYFLLGRWCQLSNVLEAKFLRIPPWSWNQYQSLSIAIGCILRDSIPFHFPAGIIICQVRIVKFGGGSTILSQDLLGWMKRLNSWKKNSPKRICPLGTENLFPISQLEVTKFEWRNMTCSAAKVSVTSVFNLPKTRQKPAMRPDWISFS